MIYLIDDTYESLLTAIFEVYAAKDFDAQLSRDQTRISLFETRTIAPDHEKANRVLDGIKKRLGSGFVYDLYCLYLADTENSSNIALQYVIAGFKNSKNIRGALQIGAVKDAQALIRRVGLEAHRLKGLVRFRKFSDDPPIFVSDIEPDHNILPLIARHFALRFGNENFVIRDRKRDLAIFCAGGKWSIAALGVDEVQTVLQTTDHIETLWKGYYKHIAIKERKNIRQQLNYMPKRYHKHILETQQ